MLYIKGEERRDTPNAFVELESDIDTDSDFRREDFFFFFPLIKILKGGSRVSCRRCVKRGNFSDRKIRPFAGKDI